MLFLRTTHLFSPTGGGIVLTGGLLLLLAGARVRGLLVASAGVALPVAIVATTIATLLAILLTKTNLGGKRIAWVVIAAWTLLPLHVVAAGALAALGPRGWLAAWLWGTGPEAWWLDGWWGALVVHTMAAVPLATLLLAGAFRANIADSEESAQLDTSAWSVVWHISLVSAWPAMLATALLVAMQSVAEIAITDLFRVRTFAEEIYTQAALGSFGNLFSGPTSSASSWLAGTGLLALGVFAAVNVFLKPFRANDTTDDPRPWQVMMRRERFAAWLIVGMIGVLLIVLPLSALLHKAGTVATLSPQGWQSQWSASQTVRAVATAPWQHRRELLASGTLAVAVATGSVLFGSCLAWQLRQRRRARHLLILLIAIGLAMPGPLVGVIVIRLLNQPLDSPFALLGELYGTWFAPWLAQMIRIGPVVTLALWPSAMAIGSERLDAARADGAGTWARLRWVVIPDMSRALLGAWCVAFALSMGELSATALVVPPGTPPLAVRLLSLLHYGVEDRVAAISLFLLGFHLLLAGVALRSLVPRRPRRERATRP